MGKSVTTEYLMGIRDGREYLKLYQPDERMMRDILANLRETLKGFSSGPVAEHLRGERDFWIGQIKAFENA